MKISNILRERLVMLMDMMGWEQDGSGLVFINVSGNGARKTFRSWSGVADFIKANQH